ncbi:MULTISPECIES: exodeoxyribonuclease III [Microbacterium]|uniref:Exodeoxyribonuclease III n=1 Tax=Microbacterium barkeri TaxID=33917 RepID=A0A9W6H3Y9_9MICO|nr:MULTISPECIES: exodeoxyribonuclease III [Microbacterium]MDI6944165.1 exodeoxyribonuclease III [Microbacterium barkeri]MDR6876736.1 exodeoxyribonuclease-3 [Microbacterium barkeri]WRH16856.1 exodeoxyribonuclease III [Microbacterium sp. JZ37]GLJ62176.1 exodeoxyribonuclease III [Microbacterium barkeri]
MSRTIRVATVNVNGIRAAARKGMAGWLDAADVDILTLQEVRGEREHLDAALPGWHILEDKALQKGRAGVAIASRLEPTASSIALGDDALESNGRWLEADFEVEGHKLTVVSAYVFTGEADTPKQEQKWAFLDAMDLRLPELAADGALAVVTGDLNVGHRELDIKNWKGNLKKAGFLPRERAYFDRWLGAEGETVDCADGTTGTGLGWVDIGRRFHGEVPGPYTWWSQRGQAFDNDAGWRIDYQLATPPLAERVSTYRVDRHASYAERWTDHAPVVVDYAF